MLEYRSFERDTTFDYSAGSGYTPRKSNAVSAIIDYELKAPITTKQQLEAFILSHKAWHQTTCSQRRNAKGELSVYRADYSEETGSWYLTLDYEDNHAELRPLHLTQIADMESSVIPMTRDELRALATILVPTHPAETSADRLNRFRKLTDAANSQKNAKRRA